VLGTRIDHASATLAVRALPALLAGVGLIVLGAAANQRLLVTAGLAFYVVGVAMAGRGLLAHARSRPPSTYASMSIGMGLIWWAACLVIIAIGSVTAPTWEDLAATLDDVAPLLAAGFAAQVLLGALSFLVPAVLGGGPARSRVSHREFNRGATLRIVVVNAGLLVLALPVPVPVRVIASVAVLAAFAAFLVLLARATRAWLRSRPSAA
jgi:nitrite reductase (NO-forming)